MSNAERFFTPQSLARVAEAVEWEEDVVQYKNGDSNQSAYMKAMAILFERWMREWRIPDFQQALQNVAAQSFVEESKRIFDSMAERIEQLVGFYQGLWAGANPGWSKSPAVFDITGDRSFRNQVDLERALRRFIQRLQAITMDTVEEGAEVENE